MQNQDLRDLQGLCLGIVGGTYIDGVGLGMGGWSMWRRYSLSKVRPGAAAPGVSRVVYVRHGQVMFVCSLSSGVWSDQSNV